MSLAWRGDSENTHPWVFTFFSGVFGVQYVRHQLPGKSVKACGQEPGVSCRVCGNRPGSCCQKKIKKVLWLLAGDIQPEISEKVCRKKL